VRWHRLRRKSFKSSQDETSNANEINDYVWRSWQRWWCHLWMTISRWIKTVLQSSCLTVFKSRLKSFLTNSTTASTSEVTTFTNMTTIMTKMIMITITKDIFIQTQHVGRLLARLYYMFYIRLNYLSNLCLVWSIHITNYVQRPTSSTSHKWTNTQTTDYKCSVNKATQAETFTGRFGLGLCSDIEWYGNVDNRDLGQLLWSCLQL